MCQVCEKMKGEGKIWVCAKCGGTICIDGNLDWDFTKWKAVITPGALTLCCHCSTSAEQKQARATKG